MPIRELRDTYGKTNSQQAINAAIRAEMPGGGEVLDAIAVLYKHMRRISDQDKKSLTPIMQHLCQAKSEMETCIAERYELESTKKGVLQK